MANIVERVGEMLKQLSPLDQRVEALLSQLTLKEKVALLSGLDIWRTVPIERLGLPSITMTDGPHGVRATRREADRPSGPTTAFPTGVSMAATWNPDLIEKAAGAMAEETRGMGCEVLLGPCVNIVRHPLAGRNFEAFSEDPYLAGRIGTAWVKGLQSQGVAASLKHFACNNQEFERDRGNSVVNERTLREIYLAQFEMIVKEAKPWTVMCSYNRINGTYASQHNYLLNDILRGEWGFDGLVVSDWQANHTIFESIQGGLDLEMPGPAKYYGRLLVEAVQHWQIEESTIDEAVRRVLKLIIRTGKLDGRQTAGSVNTIEHQQLARDVAAEAMVLLKNGGVLPIRASQIKTIAAIGPGAVGWQISGGGSSRVDPPHVIDPLTALKAKIGDQVEIVHAEGCDNTVELPTLSGEFKTEYFDNPRLEGEPAAVRTEKTVSGGWWFATPDPAVKSMKYAVRWSGALRAAQAGRYAVSVSCSAEAQVFIDGRLIVANGQPEVFVDLAADKDYAFKAEMKKADDLVFGHVRVGLAYRPDPDNRIQQAAELAARSEVVIVYAGYPENFETEGVDRPYLELTGEQNALIAAVAAANPKTIVVLNAGSPVAMPWADDVAAIIVAHYPGMDGAISLTNILCGEVNPSGKLTMTYPKALKDTPAYTNYPGARNVVYGEGIFVGYRHYEYREVEPLFPFGHGLSYTTFEYSEWTMPEVVKRGETVKVYVKVKNTGAVAGKEVAQLYVRDVQASVQRPVKELKGFAKVSLLPGEEKTVAFELNERALAYYDPDRKAWVAEPGEFEVLIGSSSRDIRLRTKFTLQ
ncbi:MAG: beta-D-glucoside glucohydrolase [Chloroflexi bacterium]|nr:beta-D-glucoside glucohydrolase [Chloroflexota bacterium]